jgi:hypothetical protein
MLGEKIGEGNGQVTGQRVVPGTDFRHVRMEVTIQEQGTIAGVDATNIGTYTVYERVPGQLYGEGQGLILLSNGDEAIWNGHGIGRPTGEGLAMNIRFSLAVQAGESGKLAALNSVLVIGEHDVSADGKTHTTMFEWK